MKRIVCELCEGTQFVKENGVFICQGCGTSYSAEEAKGMMKEMDGAAPVSSVGVGSPQANPNQQQIDNLLVLASTAYESSNLAEAESYCNKVIEIDAMCYKAWNLKGKAIGWQSTVSNNRIEESAHSFCKAIDFAPEEEKDQTKNEAVDELKKLGLAAISLRKNRFTNSPDAEELNGFDSDRKVLIDSLMVLLAHGNAVGMPEGYLEEIATMMNNAAVGAYNMATAAWRNIEHPSDSDFKTYLGWLSNIETLLKKAIDASDEDDEADIQRYKNLVDVVLDPINKSSYKQEWNSYLSRYDWVKSLSLTSSAIQSRKNDAANYRAKVSELETSVRREKGQKAQKAEEERKARIEAYWVEHADEKSSLMSEKSELCEKRKEYEAELDELNSQIRRITNECNRRKADAEKERDELTSQVRSLNSQRESLGIFAGKEKKRLTEEIAALDARRRSLNDKIAEMDKEIKKEINEKSEPINAQIEELRRTFAPSLKRINDIDDILTRDPEE